jgi:PPIC-type PPIASE domain
MLRPSIRWVLCCLCFVMLVWGRFGWAQAAHPSSGEPPLKSAENPAPTPAMPPSNKPPDTSVVPLDEAVITIEGLCDNPPADKSSSADCKTVVTRADFEKVINTLQPEMPLAQQRQLAGNYATAMMMAHEAHRLGLDQGPEFEERLRLAKLQVMAQMAMKNARAQATEVPDKEVSDYYQEHLSQFDQVSAEQIFIPLMKQSSAAKAAGGSPAKSQAEAAAEMKKEAEALRARAAGGEDFAKLQAEAFQFAGIKTAPPDVHVSNLHRGSLSPARASVMNLKPGEVSEVIADPTGFFVYKIEKKESQPLERVRAEIVNQLKAQRAQAAMQGLQHLGTPKLDDKYFGAAGPIPGAFPPRGPNAPPAASKPTAKTAPAHKPATASSSSTPAPDSGPK